MDLDLLFSNKWLKINNGAVWSFYYSVGKNIIATINHSNSCRSFSLLMAIAIRLPLLFPHAFRSVKEQQLYEAIQKRSHEPIYKTHTKIEAKRLIATTFAIEKLEEW